jgi:hypothetical protein
MHTIPWLSEINDLSGVDWVLFGLIIFVVASGAGFIVHAIMKEAGFGPLANGVIALVAALGGCWIRYRFLAHAPGNDMAITALFAMGTPLLVLYTMGTVNLRYFVKR